MRRVPLLLGLALLAGCLEEERTITLEPDGAGTLRLVRVLAQEPSEEVLAALKEKGDEAAGLRRMAASALKDFEGVVAWTDVVAAVTTDRRLRVEATGWFEDIAGVTEEVQGERRPLLELTREGERWQLALDQGRDEGDEDLGPGMEREQLAELVRKAAKGFRKATTVVVPGDVVAASGWRRDGRSLTLVLDQQLLEAPLKDLPERGATAEYDRRLRALTATSATVAVRADAATPDFRARLQDARTRWATSHWPAEVEALREKERREAAALADEDEDEDRPAAPPDALEPNDELAQARALAPGVHEGLVCERLEDDWYALTIPAGKELRVAVKLDEEHSVTVSLTDATGKERYLSTTIIPALRNEPLRLVAHGEPRDVRLRVSLGDDTPYGLDVTLTDWAAGDALEPNDEPHEAKPLPLGAHEGLHSDGSDWYVVQAAAGQVLEVSLKLTDAGGRGALRASFARAGDGQTDFALGGLGVTRFRSEQTLRVAMPGERLWLCVAGDAGLRYSLALSAHAAATDPLEPNDVPAQARALAPGKHEAVHEGPDWYRVEVPADGQVRVRAAPAKGQQGSLTLALHAADDPSRQVDTAFAMLGPAELVIARRRPGPHLVLVSGQGVFPYTLEVVSEPLAKEDPHEPNDVREDAAPLDPGAYEPRCANEDWYAVAVPAGKRLRVTLVTRTHLMLQLTLSDERGAALGEPLLAGGDEGQGATPEVEAVVEPAAEGRPVFLHVKRFYSDRNTKHALTVTLE